MDTTTNLKAFLANRLPSSLVPATWGKCQSCSFIAKLRVQRAYSMTSGLSIPVVKKGLLKALPRTCAIQECDLLPSTQWRRILSSQAAAGFISLPDQIRSRHETSKRTLALWRSTFSIYTFCNLSQSTKFPRTLHVKNFKRKAFTLRLWRALLCPRHTAVAGSCLLPVEPTTNC